MAADPLRPADYLDGARTRGRLEAVPPPYLPLREHGAVDVLDAEDVALGAARLDALAEEPAVESALCVPLLDTMDTVARDPGTAPVLLAEAFVALAGAHPLGLAHGAAAFRADAESFLDRWGPERDVRALFAARLAAQRPALEAAVRTVSPHASAWRAACAASLGVLDRDPEAAWPVLADLLTRQIALLTAESIQRYYMYYAVSELVSELVAEPAAEPIATEVEAS